MWSSRLIAFKYKDFGEENNLFFLIERFSWKFYRWSIDCNAEFPHDGLFDKVFLFTFIVIGSTDQLRQSDLIIDAMSITTCVS